MPFTHSHPYSSVLILTVNAEETLYKAVQGAVWEQAHTMNWILATA